MPYRVVTISGVADDPVPAAAVAAAIDPAKKAEFLALAKTMDDGRAEDLADIVDATPYGHRQKWIRYGLGAVLGGAAAIFVVTPVVGMLIKNLHGGKYASRGRK